MRQPYWATLTWLMALIVLAVTLAGCSTAAEKTVDNPAQAGIKVYASVYPVYDFAKRIGGDRVQLVCMVPPGADPHNWEPSPRLLARLQEADLFIYNGAGLEPWVDKLLGSLQGTRLKTVKATSGISLLAAEKEHEEPGEPGETTHHHEHGAYDPHVWLDPVLAKDMARNIAKALGEVDPQNREYYTANLVKFNQQLDELDTCYRQALARCPRREIVVTHRAFAYLCRRYNLQQVSIMGISPEAEPTPARLAEITRFCREHEVQYLFAEKLLSPRVAQIIAREVGARVLVLDPVGGLTPEQVSQGGSDYISIMYSNLENLKQALGYQP